MRFYLILIFVIALDQVSKLLIRMHLQVGDSIPFWKDVLNFTYYQNSGAAGSSFQGYARILVIPAVLLVAWVFYYRSKGKLRGVIVEIGVACLMGGAIGNAIERILFNKVTDFIDFQHGHGILNMADLAINLGVIFIIIDALIVHFSKPSLKTEMKV
jgi:signal peptidase II